jgi:lipoprotein-anchoring transpeptidase ErfK/SrfK
VTGKVHELPQVYAMKLVIPLLLALWCLPSPARARENAAREGAAVDWAGRIRAAVTAHLAAWSPQAKKRLVVSLKEQKLYLYHRDTLLGVFTVSTGRRNYTPTGKWQLYYKLAKVSYREGHGMPFWMEFKPKFGLHGLPWDKDGQIYGADELGQPASAGCVRLRTVEAELVFHVSPVGSEVVIRVESPLK